MASGRSLCVQCTYIAFVGQCVGALGGDGISSRTLARPHCGGELCVCALIPFIDTQWRRDQDNDLVFSMFFTLMSPFTYNIALALIVACIRRRRLVLLDRSGVVTFVTKAQFGIRFIAMVLVIVAVLCWLFLLIQPTDTSNEQGANVSAVLFIGLMGSILLFSPVLSLAYFTLSSKPLGRRSLWAIGFISIASVGVYTAIGILDMWGSGYPWVASDLFLLIGSAIFYVGSCLACCGLMRLQGFRIVRRDQIGQVIEVGNPIDVGGVLLRTLGLGGRFAFTVVRQLRRPWVAAPLLAMLGWLIYDWFLFDGRIRISKETTYVTEPLTADGEVDFVGAINQRLRDGVKPEENAAVELLRILGPSILPPEDVKRYCELLGIAPIPPDGHFLQIAIDWRSVPENRDERNWTSQHIYSHAWSADEAPTAAQWITDNQLLLQRVRDASRKPKCYWPVIQDRYETNVNGNLRFAHPLLLITKMLVAEGFFELGRGNWHAALENVGAIGRLGQLLMNNGTHNDWWYGGLCVGGTMRLQEALIEQIPDAELNEFIALSSELHLAPIVSAYDACGYSSRLLTLDTFVKAKRGDLQGLDEHPFEWSDQSAEDWHENRLLTRLSRSSDWNDALKVGNQWFDEVDSAMSLPDRNSRMRQMASIEARFISKDFEFRKQMTLSHWIVSNRIWTRHTRGRGLAIPLIGFVSPHWYELGIQELALQSFRDLNELSLACEAYRAEQGRYPIELSELCPAFLREIPLDRFNNQPYVYRQTASGYVLYGVGRDRADNGGDTRRDIVFKIDRSK